MSEWGNAPVTSTAPATRRRARRAEKARAPARRSSRSSRLRAPGTGARPKTKPIRLEEFQTERDWWHARAETPQAWRVSAEEIAAANYNLDFKNPHQSAEEDADVDALIARHIEIEAEVAATRERLKRELSEALSAH